MQHSYSSDQEFDEVQEVFNQMSEPMRRPSQAKKAETRCVNSDSGGQLPQHLS